MVKFDIKIFLVCHIVNNMTCKIYFIQCLETGEIYIGSTNKKYLSQRIATHRCNMTCACSQIIERGNYVYDVLEEIDESQRYIREQYYIDTTDNCINKIKPKTGLSEKEYNKQYYLDNIDRKKVYYLDNKDKIKEYSSQKYTCDCGSVMRLGEKSRHLKSNKHQNYLKISH